MIDGRKVTCWTPFGREVTVSLLVKYMERDVKRGLIDEYILYMNVGDNQESDRAYGYALAEQHDWIRIIERPERHPGPIQRSTGFFYRHATEPETIYIRLDDDIVYLHEDAIENLVRARIQMPAPVAVFGTTWNNAIVSWFAQQAGVIPREYGIVGGPNCMDSMGWANGAFAVKIHELLLEKAEQGRVDDLFLYQDFPIQNPKGGAGMQFSVSCFASLGSMYAGLPKPGVLVPDEEEHWHTVHQPDAIGHPNILIGNAIVSHYTFGPQRSHIEPLSKLLDRYRALAEKLEA